MSIIAEKRRIVKKLRAIASIPDPMVSDTNYSEFLNTDIDDMDRADLVKALREAELKLTFNDRLNVIIFLENKGFITAESWLLSRIAKIRKALKGVV